jgi:hypothetical protein
LYKRRLKQVTVYNFFFFFFFFKGNDILYSDVSQVQRICGKRGS